MKTRWITILSLALASAGTAAAQVRVQPRYEVPLPPDKSSSAQAIRRESDRKLNELRRKLAEAEKTRVGRPADLEFGIEGNVYRVRIELGLADYHVRMGEIQDEEIRDLSETLSEVEKAENPANYAEVVAHVDGSVQRITGVILGVERARETAPNLEERERLTRKIEEYSKNRSKLVEELLKMRNGSRDRRESAAGLRVVVTDLASSRNDHAMQTELHRVLAAIYGHDGLGVHNEMRLKEIRKRLQNQERIQ